MIGINQITNKTILNSLINVARLAQSVERGTFNPKVKGSSPLSGG